MESLKARARGCANLVWSKNGIESSELVELVAGCEEAGVRKRKSGVAKLPSDDVDDCDGVRSLAPAASG